MVYESQVLKGQHSTIKSSSTMVVSNFVGPLFPRLHNGNNKTYFLRLLEGWNEVMSSKEKTGVIRSDFLPFHDVSCQDKGHLSPHYPPLHFFTDVLKYNLYTIKSTHYKYTIQWYLVNYRVVQPSPQPSFRTFPSPQKFPPPIVWSISACTVLRPQKPLICSLSL